ncbi:MAG: hypothetical protein VX644_06355, partial [Planctomycetota bacterium]|nr:hypothetical protein [Planctomycetota bacterium]
MKKRLVLLLMSLLMGAGCRSGDRDPLTVLVGFQAEIEKDRDGNVTSLDLGFTQVRDAQLQYLQEFPELQILRVSSTRITDAGLIHL